MNSLVMEWRVERAGLVFHSAYYLEILVILGWFIDRANWFSDVYEFSNLNIRYRSPIEKTKWTLV